MIVKVPGPGLLVIQLWERSTHLHMHPRCIPFVTYLLIFTLILILRPGPIGYTSPVTAWDTLPVVHTMANPRSVRSFTFLT